MGGGQEDKMGAGMQRVNQRNLNHVGLSPGLLDKLQEAQVAGSGGQARVGL